MTCLCILMIFPLAIFLGLLLKGLPLLHQYSLWEIISGTVWSPMRGKFGFLPFIVSTLWVTLFSIVVAAPVSVMAATYHSAHRY